MYEIIEPVLEEGEVFDSSMLKETVNSLIASGKRNFAIDMSPLDYIYSDTINMLMALNKRVLDVTGRLSLMAPQPEVTQILKRAGIHNILRVFDTETELIKSSEDMILQTTSIKLSDVDAALKHSPPQSEFDQLRDEIGSAFGESHGSGAPSQAGAGSGDDFDQMFHQFESKPQPVNRGERVRPPQMHQPAAPQPPHFQPKQFTQPPAQPIPMRPAAPVQPRQPTEIPKFNPEYPTVRSETQRFTTAPGAPAYHEPQFSPPTRQESFAPVEEEESFEAPVRRKPERKAPVHPSFNDDDFGDDDEFKKKSAVPMLAIILLIVALGVGGAIAIYMVIGKKKPDQQVASVTPPKPAVAPVTPQIPVETPQVEAADTTAQEEEPAVEPEKEIVESKPEVRRPPVRKPVVRSTPRKTTPTKRSTPPRTKPAVQNRVVISSAPSGASVYINGEKVGITPYTWSKPVFGKVTLKISKNGYKDTERTFEFTGGSISQSLTMEKEVAPPPPPPRATTQPVVKAAPAAPKKAPPPPTSDDDDIDDPFADIGDEDDDFALEPEEPAKPVVSAPPRTTAPPPSASTSRGGEALIFIASIPPVADVYLGSQLIGKTNVSELKIPAGMQTLKFVKGGKEITKQLNLQPGKNPSQMVRIP